MISKDFENRHIGIADKDLNTMLEEIGVSSLDELISQTIPSSIRLKNELNIPDGLTEFQYLKALREIANKNKTYKSYIGQGYYNCIVPGVIQRNIFENPGWYTARAREGRGRRSRRRLPARGWPVRAAGYVPGRALRVPR